MAEGRRDGAIQGWGHGEGVIQRREADRGQKVCVSVTGADATQSKERTGQAGRVRAAIWGGATPMR